MKRARVLSFVLLLLLIAPYALAESLYNNVYTEYPKEDYLVGIGEISKTSNIFKDKRVAEVMARVEIARQIKVRVKEETLDVACEGTAGKIFANSMECKNEFVMIIEQSVDEILVGSRIVDHGENEGTVYAVAVLQRGKTSEALNRNMQDSIDKTRDSLEEAKKGNKESIKKAQEAYMKAVTYDKEKELIEGVKSNASEVFDELEKELLKLRENE